MNNQHRSKKKYFHSVYGKHIQQFIELKQQLGFKYTTGAFVLGQIDQLALQRNETTEGITKTFADAWQIKRPHESGNYRYCRVRFLAQLSAYLCDIGLTSYIPKLPPYPKHTFTPYIYSNAEMQALFKAFDTLRLGLAHPNSCLMSIPALIRLLYATGLRVGEAVALKQADVNLEKHCLTVRDSKNGKQRIIPIDRSLVEACTQYQAYRDRLSLEKKKSDHFFVRHNGQACSTAAVRNWFKKGLRVTGIAYKGRIHKGIKYPPRLHDLRHTFAVTALASMAQAGLDLYVSLPILSNYLGHQSIGATDQYVRLTQSYYPDLLQKMDTLCVDVFPSFNHYEKSSISHPHTKNDHT